MVFKFELDRGCTYTLSTNKMCVFGRWVKDMHSLTHEHCLSQSGLRGIYWKYVFDQGSLE